MIERPKRKPLDQLAELDRRLGKGIGATKERARLHAKIEEERQKEGKEKS